MCSAQYTVHSLYIVLMSRITRLAKLGDFLEFFRRLGELGNFTVSYWTGLYCIRIRTRRGIYGQIYPFPWRSSWGRSPRELLKAKVYIWVYILSWVLIWTVYHFSNGCQQKKLNKKVNRIVFFLENVGAVHFLKYFFLFFCLKHFSLVLTVFTSFILISVTFFLSISGIW